MLRATHWAPEDNVHLTQAAERPEAQQLPEVGQLVGVQVEALEPRQALCALEALDAVARGVEAAQRTALRERRQ